MKSFFLITLFLFFCADSYGQSVRSIGMGNTAISIEGNAMDAVINPAVLSVSQNHIISISATPSRFGLSELNSYEICYNKSFNYFDAGARCSLFGFDLYKELTYDLTLSKKIFSAFIVGMNINYNSISIKNYGSRGALSIDIGLIHELNKKISYGISFTNLTGSEIGGDKLDQTINAGFTYDALDELILSFRIEKNLLYKPDIKTGFEYKVIRQFAVRFGISSEPEMFFGGFGFEFSQVLFDYAFSYHNILGDTHSLSISVNLEK